MVLLLVVKQGSKDEVERQESGQALQTDFGMQTKPAELNANNSATPSRLDTSIQATEPPPSPSQPQKMNAPSPVP
jgi:hypothetical protein